MKKLLELIKEKNDAKLYINGELVLNFNEYLKKLDYTNNCLHCYFYSEKYNTITISFISEYAMSKITGDVGC